MTIQHRSHESEPGGLSPERRVMLSYDAVVETYGRGTRAFEQGVGSLVEALYALPERSQEMQRHIESRPDLRYLLRGYDGVQRQPMQGERTTRVNSFDREAILQRDLDRRYIEGVEREILDQLNNMIEATEAASALAQGTQPESHFPSQELELAYRGFVHAEDNPRALERLLVQLGKLRLMRSLSLKLFDAARAEFGDQTRKTGEKAIRHSYNVMLQTHFYVHGLFYNFDTAFPYLSSRALDTVLTALGHDLPEDFQIAFHAVPESDPSIEDEILNEKYYFLRFRSIGDQSGLTETRGQLTSLSDWPDLPEGILEPLSRIVSLATQRRLNYAFEQGRLTLSPVDSTMLPELTRLLWGEAGARRRFLTQSGDTPDVIEIVLADQIEQIPPLSALSINALKNDDRRTAELERLGVGASQPLLRLPADASPTLRHEIAKVEMQLEQIRLRCLMISQAYDPQMAIIIGQQLGVTASQGINAMPRQEKGQHESDSPANDPSYQDTVASDFLLASKDEERYELPFHFALSMIIGRLMDAYDNMCTIEGHYKADHPEKMHDALIGLIIKSVYLQRYLGNILISIREELPEKFRDLQVFTQPIDVAAFGINLLLDQGYGPMMGHYPKIKHSADANLTMQGVSRRKPPRHHFNQLLLIGQCVEARRQARRAERV